MLQKEALDSSDEKQLRNGEKDAGGGRPAEPLVSPAFSLFQTVADLSVPATTTSATTTTAAEAAFATATATAASATATETTFATATAATATTTETALTTAASATAAKAAFATATIAAASLALLLGLGFIDVQGPALQILTVQAIDSGLTCFFGGHFDESETLGPAAEFIIDDGDRVNLTEFAKGLPQIILLYIV